MSQSRNITVIGAGLMGHGIALVFARKGHRITVQDPEAGALSSLHDRVRESLINLNVGESLIPSVLDCIHTETQLTTAAAGFAVSAGYTKFPERFRRYSLVTIESTATSLKSLTISALRFEQAVDVAKKEPTGNA